MSIFFFNDTATTEIYTLSLHDALPISASKTLESQTTASADREDERVKIGSEQTTRRQVAEVQTQRAKRIRQTDRKSTRLNSSHSQISYAVFCLKKKKTIQTASEHR